MGAEYIDALGIVCKILLEGFYTRSDKGLSGDAAAFANLLTALALLLPFQIELEGTVLVYLAVDRKSGIHKSGTGIYFCTAIDAVHGVGVKPFGADIFLGTVAGQVGDDHA